MVRTVALWLVLLVSACGSATKPRDAGPAGPSDVLPGNEAPASLAVVDADPCLYPDSCEAIMQPGMCTTRTSWMLSLDLGIDAGGCEERPSLPCSFDGSPEFPLLGLLGGCPGPGPEFTMAVTFSQGCATHYYANYVPDYATACYLPILQTSRFDCIGQIPCLDMGASTLVPVPP